MTYILNAQDYRAIALTNILRRHGIVTVSPTTALTYNEATLKSLYSAAEDGKTTPIKVIITTKEDNKNNV